MQDTAHSQFIVKSNEADFISKAIMKLEVLSAHIKLRRSCPYISNLHYCEAGTDLKFQMVPLKQLEDRRLATTLVDPSTATARSLASYMCVVIVEHDDDGRRRPLNPPDIRGRPMPNGRNSSACQSMIWRHHEFVAFQYDANQAWSQPKLLDSPKKNPSETVRVGYTNIEDWLKMDLEALADTSPHELIDPNEPLPEEAERLRSIAVTNQSSTTSAPSGEPERKRHAKKRKPQATIEAKPNGIETQSGNIYTATNIEIQHSTTAALMPHLYNATTTPIHVGLSELSPPHMSPDSQPVVVKTQPRRQIQVEESQAEQLVDLSDVLSPRSFVTSSRKDAKKVDLRQTMRQKKGPSTSLSNSALTRETEAALQDVLTLCRSTTGELDLSVRLGRLLINSKTGSSEFRSRSFNLTHWNSVFPKQSATSRECDFTPRLTTHAPDVDFLLQLKYTSGRCLFQDAMAQSVFYRFKIQISHENSIILELGENGDFKISAQPQLLGAVNWHYPKRQWDSRLEVNLALSVLTIEETKVRALVDKISLVPSSDCRAVKVAVKDPQLSITGIDLLRRTTHLSETYPGLALRLTNVEEFDVLVSDNGSYTAQPFSVPYAVRQGKSWWEASIYSTSLTNLLKENESLELGEMTRWTADCILNSDALRHLEYLSRDIVTKIDTVGFYNLGPKTSSGTEKSSDPRLETRQYW